MNRLALLCVALALAGCVNRQMLLRNDQGQTIYCHGESTWGAVSAITTTHQFNDCVNEAGQKGYLPVDPKAPQPAAAPTK